MQNKVSYIVIIVLAFVCLLLSMRLSHEGNVAKQAEPAEQAKTHTSEPTNSKDTWNVISLSTSEQEMFVADEYKITFSIIQKQKEKSRAFSMLNESREKVLSMLKELNVDKSNCDLHSMRISNDIERRDGKRIKVGYEARQDVEIKLSSKSLSDAVERKLGTLDFIDDFETVGGLKNADSLEVETIKRTCKKVLKQADVYARSVGAKAGVVLAAEGNSNVDESNSYSDSVGVRAYLNVSVQLKGRDGSKQSYVQVNQGESKKFLADLFTISAGAVVDGDDREKIYAQVARVKDSIVALARNLGVAESEIDVHTARIGLKSKWEFITNKGAKKNRFKARQFVTVNFTSKQDAAAFLAEVGGAENVTVGNVSSILKNEDSLRVFVTEVAGRKAMARAKAIAEGFGGSLGDVVYVGNNSSYDYNIVNEISYASSARGNSVLGNNRGISGNNSFAEFDGLPGLLGGGDASGMIADSVEVSSSVNVIAELK
ncbi:MAG: SIMPL domain-containing protein [Fibrobacter sp.]|nr:SIMPL domain-containing protein [Fibrobacter sp.]